eukprot:EG_transcript_30155
MSTCAICMDTGIDPVSLPCCGRRDSTVQYCLPCIRAVCDLGGGVGRCPTCRTYLRVGEGGRVEQTTEQGVCRLCRQLHVIVDQGLCDACLLGVRCTLTYECERCHRRQRIPHPMWRYQPTATSFGSATWACHQSCGDYTTWRIAPEDVDQIPLQECPESWGRREQWMASVLQQRQRPTAPAVESGRCSLM